MTEFRIEVIFADGDDFTRTFFSDVRVEAPTEREARLTAEQIIHTPMLGKPDHIQIIGVTTVEQGARVVTKHNQGE